jgi:subtilisin family serine protease
MTALAPDDVETWIVAFEPPADDALRGAIAAAGGRIVGYVPSNAYLVRAESRVAAGLRRVPGILRADRYRPEWKISPAVGRVRHEDAIRALERRLWLQLEVFEGETPGNVAAAARAAGAEVLGVAESGAVRRVVVLAEPDATPALARISAVEWIEEVPDLTLRNDVTRWVIQSNDSLQTPLYDNGLFGEGQIFGHIDGKIQAASCFFDDPGVPIGPMHRKIVGLRGSTSTNGQAHGTHTAGTLAGDQFPINGSIVRRGMAPLARISHQNFNDLEWIEVTGQPSNLYDFLAAAHADGARIHSNSWGDDLNATYTSLCRDVDLFARDHEHDLVVFSVTNQATIKTPENAKNVLAVGASWSAPNQHVISDGGQGPTNDGRRKPEVFAPGRGTNSASTVACGTSAMNGTSMACPAVAGGAALVREYLVRGYHPTGQPSPGRALLPSGALLKAIVINSAVDMTGVANYPTDQEGWGRILLDDALYFPGDTRRLWFRDVTHANGLSTGATDEFALRVVGSSEPLKITMVFTDHAASIAADPASVHDLDLEVEGPNGLFLGNEFDVLAGVSRTGGVSDPRNNVERVIVATPAPGTWTVRVHGTDCPLGTQGYAVVANGDFFHAMESSTPGPTELEAAARDTRPAPESFRLSTMTPNPFRDATEVRYAVPEPVAVRIEVYDVRGRLVRALVDRPVSAGEFRATWDGRDAAGRPAAPGIYFVRLTAPGVERTVKGVLLR